MAPCHRTESVRTWTCDTNYTQTSPTRPSRFSGLQGMSTYAQHTPSNKTPTLKGTIKWMLWQKRQRASHCRMSHLKMCQIYT